MIDEAPIRARYQLLAALLDERARRLVAGAEAIALGQGGAAAVAGATGLARSTVQRGIADIRAAATLPAGRIRRAGPRRPGLLEREPTLGADLEALIEPIGPGVSASPLRWTTKSVRGLAAELQAEGHRVSHETVAELLRALGYRLQATLNNLARTSSPDRNAEFARLNAVIELQGWLGEPVIGVDTRKRKARGGPLRSTPRRAAPDDGADGRPASELARASHDGVPDLDLGEAWECVATDRETAAFAADCIKVWWQTMGASLYPAARRLLIVADEGGSRGSRARLSEPQLPLADESGLEMAICPFPPGSFKWRRIEHRLFSTLSRCRRGRPVVSHEVAINLIKAAAPRSTTILGAVETGADGHPIGRATS